MSEYSYVEDYEWFLGDDIDCDLCGLSFNTLRLEIDNQFKDWRIYTRVGCYDGEEVKFGDSKTPDDFLDRYLDFAGMSIDIKIDIINKINKKEIEWGLI